MPKGKRKTFTPELKLAAVHVKKSGKFKMKEIAEMFDVNRQTIYRWEKEYDTHGEEAFKDNSVLPGHLVERKSKRMKDLEMENEILKKAAAYFAKKNQLE